MFHFHRWTKPPPVSAFTFYYQLILLHYFALLLSLLSLSLSLPVSDVSDVEVFGLITRIVRLYVGPSLSVAFNTISLVRIPSGIGVVM